MSNLPSEIKIISELLIYPVNSLLLNIPNIRANPKYFEYTYSIAINCSGVSDHIKIYGMDYIPQWGIQLNPQYTASMDYSGDF
ncbi:hypothetical protein ES705_14277 [subsurface metagenome]